MTSEVFMKKKFFGFLSAVVALLSAAICTSACEGGKSGVSLHGKTYTLGTDITWSYYVQDANGVKTTVGDPVAYLTERWVAVMDGTNFPAGCRNAQQVVDAFKARIEDPDDEWGEILLKGAVITIGKENRISERKWESTLECTMNNQSVAYFPKVFTETFNKNRYSAIFEGSSMSEFKLTDYSGDTKAINNIYAKLCVAKTSPATGTQYVYYSNVSTMELYMGSNPTFVVEGRVDLVSVS